MILKDPERKQVCFVLALHSAPLQESTNQLKHKNRNTRKIFFCSLGLIHTSGHVIN